MIDVTLERAKDAHEYINGLKDRVADDPRYRFVFMDDYYEYSEELKSPGWTRDRLLIKNHGDTVGYIDWGINRSSDAGVSSVTIMIEPKYLDTGIGAVASIKWLDYVLRDRGVRRVELMCAVDNVRMRKIYDRMTQAVGGREIGRKTEYLKLRDGQYYDSVSYEIMRADYRPDDNLLRTLARLEYQGGDDGTQDDD